MTTTAEATAPPRRVWRIDALSPLLALVGLVLGGLIPLPIG